MASKSEEIARGSWLDTYRVEGFEAIDGWVAPEALDMLQAADAAQQSLGVGGGAMEIGIYRGRFFTALNGLVKDPSTPSLALDVFDDALNIDGSGKGGSESIFRENLRLYDRHQGSNVVILHADSTSLRPEDVLDRLTVRPRIVSVDGGHTPEHTISDIELAHSVMNPRGLVFVDDVLNIEWLGVIEGLVIYLRRRPTLWPMAIGHNKLILAPMTLHRKYRTLFKQYLTVYKTVTLCGYDVLVVGRAKPKAAVRASDATGGPDPGA